MSDLRHKHIFVNLLHGKTISDVRYMTTEEASELGWHSRPLVIFFSDGTQLFPMRDDEGNDGGAMHYSHDDLMATIYTLRND